MAPMGALLWRRLRVYQIYGANTDVGKTVFTTILCRGARNWYQGEQAGYLKPVATGPLDETDAAHICKHAQATSYATLHQYDEAVSPHTAARGKVIPSDPELVSSIYAHVAGAAARGPGWFFVETAGGILSPGPTGTAQADLYRGLRAPVVLAGDARLGGISATVAAFESLRLRGYDVAAVLLFDDPRHRNREYLARRLGDDYGVPVVGLPPPPPRAAAPVDDANHMARFYAASARDDRVRGLLAHLATQHDRRIQALEGLPARSLDTIWYPFTQHQLLSPHNVTAIDSAYGDHFATLRPEAGPPSPETAAPASASAPDGPLLQASFDGSASWWTQGLGHGDPGLALAAAYAAGRYGHVMFAEAAHAPALALAEALLAGLANPRLARVFYSDDGSTGVEVAIKMALCAARVRYDGGREDEAAAAARPLDIVGLRGAYHGDTIGAMDCAEPSAFNRKVEWYQGKGLWFDPPAVLCRGDGWEVTLPASWNEDGGETASTGTSTKPPRQREFASLAAVFDLDAREARGEHRAYEQYIEAVLRAQVGAGRRFGALVMEPVVLGAGGMVLVDPLFQRALVTTVRRLGNLFGGSDAGTGATANPADDNPHDWAGLPVVFDEVFTGLYRLGRFGAASFLGVDPDISVHAKLLTGGLVPLCATLASAAVFGAFASDAKADALLHGHSYTAHPVGCEVAGAALRRLRALEDRGAWDWAKHGAGRWLDTAAPAPAPAEGSSGSGRAKPDGPWSIWSRDLVHDLARRPAVDGAWALGSVLAVHLRAPAGAGYTSTAAVALRDALRTTARGPEDDGDAAPWNLHSRVLGNVLYVMGSQRTGPEEVREIDTLLRKAMDAMAADRRDTPL